MRDFESIVILALIVAALTYFWKKLLRKNRQDASHGLSLKDLVTSSMPDTAKDRAPGKQEEPKEAKGADQKKENEEESPAETAKERTAMEMCLEFLRKYNCKLWQSVDRDDNYCTEFQGATFILNTWNVSIVEIIYPNFHTIPLDNYEDISRIRKVINQLNIYSYMTLFYAIDKEEKKFIVSMKRDCFLFPDTEDADEVLYSVFSACFGVARHFLEELDEVRREEEQEK